MVLAVPYLLIASTLTALIDEGGPGWLHLMVLIAVWNAMKFAVMGPISVILLALARADEWRQHRRLRRSENAVA